MLGGHHDGVEPDRLIAHVLDGDLGLAVRPDVWDLAGPADLGQLLSEPVREHDGQRHQLRGLAARIPEHQALVTSALAVELVVAFAFPVLESVRDALGDVRRLRPDRHRYATGRAVESLGRRVVADL